MTKTPYQIRQEINRLEKDRIYKLNTEDPKAGFTFGTKGVDKDIENASRKFEYVLPNKPLDYVIAPEPEPEIKIDTRKN